MTCEMATGTGSSGSAGSQGQGGGWEPVSVHSSNEWDSAYASLALFLIT